MIDPAADYVWAGWGRPGRCLPVDAERVGEYECAWCERPITRDMDPDAPCPGRGQAEGRVSP
jgi:hypothetical protein